METYIFVLAGLGALILLTAWLPMLLRELPLSLPIICVGLGAIIFSLPVPGPAPVIQEHLHLTERVTEFVVIVALMGAGLKLDEPLSWRRGMLTWRLLAVAMPLTIVALAFLGWSLLQVSAAGALLLAAALAPTDPVLASDVQVGPPRSGTEDEVRYTLTAEAGLNDGLAFPFVHLALAIAVSTSSDWLGNWLLVDVGWKLLAGLGMGWLVGSATGWLMFHLPVHSKIARTGDGFVALGVTCIAYAVTEMAGGYGFLAVFIAALRIRAAERDHEYHDTLHAFIEQLERLLMMLLLVLFGGAIAAGLFAGLTWAGFLYALVAIFLVRPAAGWISLFGSGRKVHERAVLSFFGIRGLGSAYYLSYGLNHGKFDSPDVLWSVAGLIVLLSILIHGTTVTPVMRWFDQRSGRDGDNGGGSEAARLLDRASSDISEP